MKKREPTVCFILAIIIVVCCLLASFIPAQAAPTFTVNSTVDVVDAHPGDGTCATAGSICTLRAAIMEANHTPGGGATIILPVGTYTLTIVTFTLTDDETTGDLDITANMSIVGAGSSSTIIDGNGSVVGIDGVFEIHPGAIANISGVTIRNGNVRSNFRNGEGGGIFNGGTLTLTDSTVSGNSAPNAGAGIYNDVGGTLTLTNSTLSDNTGVSGGGIFNNEGASALINSTVSGNKALLGGGILNGGRLTLKNSAVSGNSASGQGGGIYSGGTPEPSTELINSTVSGNHSATGNPLVRADGGGIYHIAGTLTMISSTVSGNTASGSGGGINNGQPPFTATVNIFNSTIAGNTAGSGTGIGVGGGVSTGTSSTTTFQNTILSGNFAEIIINNFPVLEFDDCAGTIVSDGHNLMGIQNCTVSGAAPIVADPKLGPLQNNGGPTQTHALLAGSPAIDAGDCTLGPKPGTDQRGFPRTVDGNGDGVSRCDIGAFELGSRAGVPVNYDLDFDGDGKNDIGVYRDGLWFIKRSSDGGQSTVGWGGLPQDVAVPGDYDGDGKTDVAVYRDKGLSATQALWFIKRSSDGGTSVVQWGGLVQDIPVPGDYDGDGKTDPAVYRDGTWFILRSFDGGVTTTGWGGLPQDVPVAADYDGDGRTDVAVYRDGVWFILLSRGGVITTGWGGLPQDIPVPADYDGDGKTDIAVYRDGTWFIRRSSDGGVTVRGWGGLSQDVPVPADYDGDGKADMAVYRDGEWFILRSFDGGVTATGWGGLPQDIPLNRRSD